MAKIYAVVDEFPTRSRLMLHQVFGVFSTQDRAMDYAEYLATIDTNSRVVVTQADEIILHKDGDWFLDL